MDKEIASDNSRILSTYARKI